VRERTTSDQTSSAGVPGREEGRRERTLARVHTPSKTARERGVIAQPSTHEQVCACMLHHAYIRQSLLNQGKFR